MQSPIDLNPASTTHDSINKLRLVPNDRLAALHALQLSERTIDSLGFFLKEMQRVFSGLLSAKPSRATSPER
jgi:hypothetical protein